MAPEAASKKFAAAEFDVIQNRLAIALAKRESLIKSWTKSSARPQPPPKTKEQIEAEDADIYKREPATLGLGAPVPKEYKDGDMKRAEIKTNESLRKRLLGKTGGLQASKPRDAAEKAQSAKRRRKDDSSDEEEGRSSLGKAKKVTKPREEPVKVKTDTKPLDIKHPLLKTAVEEIKKQGKANKKLVDYSSSDDGSRSSSKSSNKRKLDTTNTPTSHPAADLPPITGDIPKQTSNVDLKVSTPTSALSSKTVSKQSSPNEGASSDSDESEEEMEVEIPQGLTTDAIAPTVVAPPPATAEEKALKKKEKNRRKQQRKREKQKAKQEAEALAKSGGNVEGYKKIKDKLLNKGGN